MQLKLPWVDIFKAIAIVSRIFSFSSNSVAINILPFLLHCSVSQELGIAHQRALRHPGQPTVPKSSSSVPKIVYEVPSVGRTERRTIVTVTWKRPSAMGS